MSFWDEEIRTIYRERDREEMRWKAILKENAWIWRRWLSMADEHKSLTRKGEATIWHLRIDGCDVRRRAAGAYIGADQCLLFSHMLSSAFVDPDFSPRFTVWWGDDDLNRMLPSRTKDGLAASREMAEPVGDDVLLVQDGEVARDPRIPPALLAREARNHFEGAGR